MYNKDLLSIKDLTIEEIENIFVESKAVKTHYQENIAVNGYQKITSFYGKTIANLFFEPSTRTKTSFEIAAKRLSANVVNFNPQTSSLSKGESAINTAQVFEAMGVDALIVRHELEKMPYQIARAINIPVINAGDGINEHPSQALLDLFTVQQYKGQLEGLTVAIIGDITHSRVARSDIYGFLKMGAEVRVAGPPPMLPSNIKPLEVKTYTSLREALGGADVVMALRIQFERHDQQGIDTRDYVTNFQLTEEKMKFAKKDAILMHPGPVNWGTELHSNLIEYPSNVILEQVRNGVFVRMAILSLILGN